MKIKVVTMHICQPCLDGIGAECHTPECVMWLHRVDLPFDPRTYEVQREYDTPNPRRCEPNLKEAINEFPPAQSRRWRK